MKGLGKVLFWFGFIILIGIVMAYLILLLAGALAYVTASAILILCGVILAGTLLMLLGRAYERRGERKESIRKIQELESKVASSASATTPAADTTGA